MASGDSGRIVSMRLTGITLVVVGGVTAVLATNSAARWFGIWTAVVGLCLLPERRGQAGVTIDIAVHGDGDGDGGGGDGGGD